MLEETVDEMGKKRIAMRNQHMLEAIEEVKSKIKSGEAISAMIYMRYKGDRECTLTSYSDTPEIDAGTLLSMALGRLGFVRE